MCVWMEGQLVCICVKGSAFSTIPQCVYTYWNDVMPLARVCVCVCVCAHVCLCVRSCGPEVEKHVCTEL